MSIVIAGRIVKNSPENQDLQIKTDRLSGEAPDHYFFIHDELNFTPIPGIIQKSPAGRPYRSDYAMIYEKILLATDGSENARRAAAEAAGFARDFSSCIIIVYIVSNPPSQSRMAKANFDVHSILEEDAKTAIKDTIDLFESEGLPYTLKVAIGDPATEIIDTTGKENADLVIIGSRGLGTIKGAVLGSVSRKVTHNVKCPVMIVK